MIYVFYNNDPLGNDQGGGAEHFRGIYRVLQSSGLDYRLIACKQNPEKKDEHVEYISKTPNFLFYFINLFYWFFKNRKSFNKGDIFHFHRNYAAWPKYLFAKRVGKTIVTYHNTTGLVIANKLGLFSPLVRSIMLFFEKKAVSIADKIIFVSDRDRQALKNIVIKNNYNKTVVIPAAFDSTLFVGAKPPPKKSATKIIAIGRIAYQKNFELAIDVFTNLKDMGLDYSLSIIGDGELKKELLLKISNNNYSKDITFHGVVQHKDIPELIAAYGIVLVTSRFEASPTIVKEAIASKRPVVTTDVGDVNVWVDNKNYGFVCEHNVKSLTEGILKATDLIVNGTYKRTIDMEKFSEKKIMGQLLEVYRNL